MKLINSILKAIELLMILH